MRDDVTQAEGQGAGAAEGRRRWRPTLKGAADFAKAAKAAGVEVKTTELVARDSPLPEIGRQPAGRRGGVRAAGRRGQRPDRDRQRGAPSSRCVEHKQPTPAEFAAARDSLRDELLNERRSRFFSAYMLKAKQKMKIEVNRENLQRVIG